MHSATDWQLATQDFFCCLVGQSAPTGLTVVHWIGRINKTKTEHPNKPQKSKGLKFKGRRKRKRYVIENLLIQKLERILQKDVFLMQFCPESSIIRGKNTTAERSGSFLNKGKIYMKSFHLASCAITHTNWILHQLFLTQFLSLKQG